MPLINLVCRECAQPFAVEERYLKRGGGKYCSVKCAQIAVQKIRWQKHHAEVAQWFWLKVDRSDATGCWPWTGRRMAAGYGRLVLKGQHKNAHRIAYQLSNGPIPEGMFACHRCDNPPCCNPAHLFLGTHSDNMADRHAKGRYASGKAALRSRQEGK